MPGNDARLHAAAPRNSRRKSLQENGPVHVRFQEQEEIFPIERDRASTLPSQILSNWRERRMQAKAAAAAAVDGTDSDDQRSPDSPRDEADKENNTVGHSGEGVRGGGGASPRLMRQRSNTLSSETLTKFRTKDSLAVPSDPNARRRSSSFGNHNSGGSAAAAAANARRRQQQQTDNGLISPLARQLGRSSLKKHANDDRVSPCGSQNSIPEVSAEMYIDYCMNVVSNELLCPIQREPLPPGSDVLHEVLNDIQEDAKPRVITTPPSPVKSSSSRSKAKSTPRQNGHYNGTKNNKTQGQLK